MRTKRISPLLLTVFLTLILLAGCTHRYQRKVDEAMLIQENLQLDQALGIAQYELELTRQENDSLRKQLEENSLNYRNRNSSDSLPSLRTNPKSVPSFNQQDALPYENSLPPPNSPEDTPPILQNQSILHRPNYYPSPIQQTAGTIGSSPINNSLNNPPENSEFPTWSPYRK
ncbi:MAG: hypothetical protein LBJ67_11185 [Planctomycetaceae bacterium]|jgi:hypothetical protein|nr:hypothetical protein [Planctomycetaceae bacterium]